MSIPACWRLSRLRIYIAAVIVVCVCPDTSTAQCQEGCVAIHTFVGEAAGDQFGWKSNAVGDLDNDGVLDVVITAPTRDTGGNNTGTIYVYSGATGQELWRANGPTPGGQLGTDAWAAGRIDADTTPDVIAGAPHAGAGRAIVFDGTDGSILQQLLGQVAGDRFGFRVAGGGDANGDGHADVLVTATFHDTAGFNAGRVYVYDGTDFTLLCTADGESANDQLGTAVAFIGDLDGDGCDEFVVGAKDAGPTNGGRAYVYGFDGKGCVLRHTFDTPAGAIDFGHLFADGGRDVDVDAKGIPDIYVGDFAGNRAYVYSGADWSLLHTFQGDNNGGFGLGEIIDDVNDDGHVDLILAAWQSPNGGSGAGKVFVYSGGDGSILYEFTHDIPGAAFGFDANGVGDVNGDGRADYLVTAAWDMSNRGRAYLISGAVGVPADLNGDGVTGIIDFLMLLSAWGPCADCTPGWECPADLNNSCDVGIADFLTLLANWG